MIKKIILYDNMMFASPRHLMNYFRKHNIGEDITINYLNQCVYKKVKTVKGIELAYRTFDYETNDEFRAVYDRVKSLVRSGDGYIVGKVTPIDYFKNVVEPLMSSTSNPVDDAIDRALEQGIGTRKDYDEMIKIAQNPGRIHALHTKRKKKFNDIYKRIERDGIE